MANYAFTTGKQLPSVSNGHTFDGYTFRQKLPHTPIFQGITGLIFRNCNLRNCDVPTDAIIDGCRNDHVSVCSHLHPDWDLTPCAVNCTHVVSSDVIQIDGVVIETIYEYADKVV